MNRWRVSGSLLLSGSAVDMPEVLPVLRGSSSPKKRDLPSCGKQVLVMSIIALPGVSSGEMRGLPTLVLGVNLEADRRLPVILEAVLGLDGRFMRPETKTNRPQ